MSRQSSSRNAGLTDLRLRRLRSENQGGQPASYQREGDIATPIPGDDDAPFFKAPPFPSNVELWRDDATAIPLLAAADYEALDAIDIGQTRLVTTWLRYTSASDLGQLSLIGAVADYSGDFYPIGVINPTPTAITIPNGPFDGPFISRTFAPAEFRSPVIADTLVSLMTLVWDVGQYNRFRLYVGDLAGQGETAGNLEVRYSFSE